MLVFWEKLSKGKAVSVSEKALNQDKKVKRFPFIFFFRFHIDSREREEKSRKQNLPNKADCWYLD